MRRLFFAALAASSLARRLPQQTTARHVITHQRFPPRRRDRASGAVLLCRPRHADRRQELSAADRRQAPRRQHRDRDGRSRYHPGRPRRSDPDQHHHPRCRDNPLAQQVAAAGATRSVVVRSGLAAPSGLGAGATQGAGTLIAFATAPGQVALGCYRGAVRTGMRTSGSGHSCVSARS